MKNKLLFGAVAALMVTACSQDDVVTVRQDGIDYSVSTETLTRAADSYCNSALPDYFKVWANSSSGLYINGDKILNNSGVWTDDDGTRYWPDDLSLDFYAEVNGDDVFNFNDGAPTFDDFTVKDLVADQLDLMYSVKKDQTKSVDKVQLNFRHALAQVCFKAKNNMKNMSVVIKGVSVGHLTNKGTFTFPKADTDENFVQHSDALVVKALSGGSWSIPADAEYGKQYDVTPLEGNVALAPGENSNLTCPDDEHVNGFSQVLTLLPQTVEAWDPKNTEKVYDGAYFLLDLELSNVVKDDEGTEVSTVAYTGKAAIPVSIAWEQGYRYIYTFMFDEGSNGGWTPYPDSEDSAYPEEPSPVLTSIKYDVTVDDFIPVSGDGDGTSMDTGKEEAVVTTYSTTITLHANDGETESVKTINLNSTETAYSFTLAAEYTPTRENYDFVGWATTAEADAAAYAEGTAVAVDLTQATLDLYAVWKSKQTTITLSYDVLDGTPAIDAVTETVNVGESVTLTLSSTAPVKAGQYQFLGWSTTKKTEEVKLADVEYVAGSTITISQSTTLYALYGKTTAVIGGGGSSSGFDN
jgi:uncharacterized repeat protein (TIGR02543 family)